MTIAAEKLNKVAFDDVFSLIVKYPWLQKLSDPLVELWNLCDLKEQQELLKVLFDRFTFIDLNSLEETSTSIYKAVIGWDFVSLNTSIVAVADDGEIDGSIAGLQNIKNKFPSNDGWEEKNFYSSIGRAGKYIKNGQNVVLFDDFIGSGNTLIRKIQYLKNSFEESGVTPLSLNVVAFAGMKFGIERIKNSCGVEVYARYLLKRGISDYDTPEVQEAKKLIMLSLEKKLGKKFKKLRVKDFSLGYGNSETLYQVGGQNCPNNLFPIFWWPILLDGAERKTLFNRIR